MRKKVEMSSISLKKIVVITQMLWQMPFEMCKCNKLADEEWNDEDTFASFNAILTKKH